MSLEELSLYLFYAMSESSRPSNYIALKKCAQRWLSRLSSTFSRIKRGDYALHASTAVSAIFYVLTRELMAIISQKADAINEVVAALYEPIELPDNLHTAP